jgi:hypothetical protein
MVGVKEVCSLEFADKFSVARLELKAQTQRERERERERGYHSTLATSTHVY